MKGAFKAVKRAPHLIGSRVGMSAKSSDPEIDELVRRFAGLEDYTTKLVKDTASFREGIASMISSQDGFGTAFTTLFQPILNEASLTSTHPEAATTLRNIASYQVVMADLRDALQPELELIDSRVIAPLREYQEVLKKIRKTITKREHKLVDYDRANNSYKKLNEKKEKSLSDEKNMFKFEQDLELATSDYEHYNNALKSEIPHFFQLSNAFIAPLFQTFYFVEVGILYTLLEKLQGWSGQTYGDMDISHLESMHAERLGDTVAQLEELTITKRYMGSARVLATNRQNSGDSGSFAGRSSVLNRAPSTASSLSRPPVRSAYGASSATSPVSEAPPPPYTGGSGSRTLAGKRPPPPPPSKPRMNAAPAVEYVTALYDYEATAAGDLSFNTGDRIEIVKRTDNKEDWWTGRANGAEGQFPANYVE